MRYYNRRKGRQRYSPSYGGSYEYRYQNPWEYQELLSFLREKSEQAYQIFSNASPQEVQPEELADLQANPEKWIDIIQGFLTQAVQAEFERLGKPWPQPVGPPIAEPEPVPPPAPAPPPPASPVPISPEDVLTEGQLKDLLLWHVWKVLQDPKFRQQLKLDEVASSMTSTEVREGTVELFQRSYRGWTGKRLQNPGWAYARWENPYSNRYSNRGYGGGRWANPYHNGRYGNMGYGGGRWANPMISETELKGRDPWYGLILKTILEDPNLRALIPEGQIQEAEASGVLDYNFEDHFQSELAALNLPY